MAYTTYQQFTYSCMECGQMMASSIQVKNCRKCSMELCSKCYTKHGSVCIWCLEAASATPLWLMKIAKILMVLSPLFGFLVPAPIPVVFLLITNPINWLWAAVYTGMFLIVSGILLGSAKAAALKSIVVKIPPPTTPAPAPARDEPALLQAAVPKQSMTYVSMAEQPYNPQLGNVQASTPPLRGMSAQIQEPSLVFDITGAKIDAAEEMPANSAGPTATPETQLLGASPQLVTPTNSPGEAGEGSDQQQNLSISSLDSQLLGDISSGEDQQPGVAIDHPDDFVTDHPVLEGQESLQKPIENEEKGAKPLEWQAGGAVDEEQAIQAPTEQLIEQVSTDTATADVPQEFQAGVDLPGEPEQQVEQVSTDTATADVPQEFPASVDVPGEPEQQLVGEPLAPSDEALVENEEQEVVPPSQDGANLLVDEPRADAINDEPAPEPEAQALPSADHGNDVPSPNRCPNCGKEFDAAVDVFCTDCGFDLKE